MATEPTPLPVACTLGARDLQERRRARIEPMARTPARPGTTPTRVRLRFPPEADEQLRELALLETGCCSFASWDVRPEPGAVVLDVSASGDGVAAVRELFPAA